MKSIGTQDFCLALSESDALQPSANIREKTNKMLEAASGLFMSFSCFCPASCSGNLCKLLLS